MTQKTKPEEHFLSNGVPVILQHFEGPVGTLHWWNLTGSTDEAPQEAGFAHFLEHMLFKDAAAKETGMASTGQTARVIESLGGEINAYTSFDQTVYHVTCSEQYWEEVIDQFGIMAKPQQFLKEDFEREREVILEELRRGQDSPDRQLYENLFDLTYSKHPYGKPVIGYEKVLKAAKVKDLERFYQKHYVSAQMGLVLVGPLAYGNRKEKILKLLEKRYGKKAIPTRKPSPRIRPEEKQVQAKARFKSTFFDVKTPELAISFRIPDLMNPDIAPLEVLAGVLGMGEASRLYQKLFYEKSLVTDISTSVYVPRDPGMFLLSSELKSTADVETVCALLVEEIRSIQTGGAKKEEIERVIANLESEKLYATQTVDGIANRLGFLKYSLGDLNFDHEYLETLKQTTSHSLKLLAQKYLTPQRMSFVLLQPKGEEKVQFEPIAALFEPLSPPETNPKAPKKAANVKKTNTHLLAPSLYTAKHGLRVAYFYRPGTPVFSLYLANPGGTRYEWATDLGKPGQCWGGSHLLAQTWAKGTENYTSKQISQIIEGCAASLDGFSGRNSIGLQMTGLVRDWNKLSQLFQEVLLKPTFSVDEIAHAKRVTGEQIKSLTDHSSQVCSKLFLENIFTEHPYGKYPLGTLETLEKLNQSDLKAIHQKWLHPKHATFTLVGGISFEEAKDWIDELDEAMGSQHSHWIEPPRILAEPKLNAPRWAHSQFNREQTHIMIGGLGISLFDQSRYALRILQNILGGQSGRLFIELREKKSLAYTVSPMNMEGLEPGYVGTYIACAPQKKDEAIAGMTQVLEKLVEKGPTAAEMKRATNYYLGQRAMDLQSTWSLAAGFGLELLYRNQVIPEETIRKEILKVTARDIQKMGEALFLTANKVTVTVG